MFNLPTKKLAVFRVMFWILVGLITQSILFGTQPGYAQVVPNGFTVINVNTNLDNDCIGFALLPDGRIMVINQFSGTVQLIVNWILKSTPLLTVPELDAVLEKGLLGVAVDPDFPNLPYIYLFHSHTSNTNRISRFTVEGDLTDPNSQNLTIQVSSQLLLVNDLPATNSWHNGGTLRFGSDKTLYISHGDDGRQSLVQDLATLNGKILRINRDGSIPSDNPTFPNEPQGKRAEIFAFGLRNPFRFSIDELTDQLFIGDVGQDSMDELDESSGGENFGWPYYEGSLVFNSSANLIQPNPEFPIWEYSHSTNDPYSVIALTSYRQNDFPNDFSFPNEFDGRSFYADFFHDWIRNIRPDGTGGWTSVDFATGFPSLVDGALGSDGSIYVLEYGEALRKIIYMNPPVPVELSTFSANVEGNKVVLIWKTETETNNFGFEVQKSLDGQVFEKIGFVRGQGSSTLRKGYVFEDLELYFGRIFYRLKQIDTNGSFEYSPVISVDIAQPTEFVLSQNYPNPFNPSTRITIKLPKSNSGLHGARHAKLTIYDIRGREVARLLDGPMLPGTYTFTWDGRNQNGVPVGSDLYVYSLEFGGIRQAKKMIFKK